MIIPTTEKRSVTTCLLASSLLLLSGCFGEKDKETVKKHDGVVKTSDKAESIKGQGELLLSIDGKPVLYAQDFEDQKAMALQSDQRLSMILQIVPNAERDMIFNAIKSAQVLKEWAIRNKVDQTPEFAKTLRQYQDAILTQMCMKAYQDAHPITVTEHEAEEFYKSHRDKIQGLMISPAGIDVLCVKFDKKDEAERFNHKIKDGSKKHFENVAKESNLTVIPMVINEEGYADEVLKSAVLAAKKFPSKEMIKMNDGSYMIVGITGKKDPEYHSFNLPEVKQGITRMCMDEKREAAQLADVAKFEKEYGVVANTEYFDKKAEVAANIQKSLQLAHNLAKDAQEQPTEIVEFEEDEIMFEDKI